MKLGSMLVGACLAALATAGHAQGIADGDFAAWNLGAYGVGGSAKATVETAGGAPGARLQVSTITLPGDTAFATALKSDFASTDPLAGARFSMSLDVASGEGAYGGGQAIALVLEQSGTLYALPVGETGVRTAVATVPFSGSLDAGSFLRVAGSGPAQPVLDGSAATRFGFAAGNSGGLAQTQYYDNFRLEIAAAARAAKAVAIDTVASIPTLSDLALVMLSAALGIAGIALARSRRAG